MSFEEIAHTADVRIRAKAATLPLLFSELCSALMQVMYGTARESHLSRTIRLPPGDPELLLRDFLSEILFVSEVDGVVFSDSEVTFDERGLSAMLRGEPFDRARHTGGTEVKGISYSGLSISHDANGYIAEIVFDV